MMRILENLSSRFGRKDLADYPELFRKRDKHVFLDYDLAIYNSALWQDEVSKSRSVNWRAI
jgi:hypothetical protein